MIYAQAPAAFSASTVLGMSGSSAMFAIGPFFAIETKSLMVAVGAMVAGFSVFMAVGRRACFYAAERGSH